jgi:hypothetical protein
VQVEGDFLVRKASKTAYQLMVKDGGKLATFEIAYVERLGILDLQGRKHTSLDDTITGVYKRHLIGPNSNSIMFVTLSHHL